MNQNSELLGCVTEAMCYKTQFLNGELIHPYICISNVFHIAVKDTTVTRVLSCHHLSVYLSVCLFKELITCVAHLRSHPPPPSSHVTGPAVQVHVECPTLRSSEGARVTRETSLLFLFLLPLLSPRRFPRCHLCLCVCLSSPRLTG